MPFFCSKFALEIVDNIENGFVLRVNLLETAIEMNYFANRMKQKCTLVCAVSMIQK